MVIKNEMMAETFINIISRIYIYAHQCASHQEAVEVFDENRDDPQQSHADGEIRLLHGRRRRRAGTAALPELDVGREQLDDQRTNALLQQETELLMLHRERSEGQQLGTSHFL